MVKKPLDVAVVGGGVIGAACARFLAARGLTVAIFEPGPVPGAASPASAGMLAAQIEPLPEGALALAVVARNRYEALAPALKESTGVDIALWQGGIAALAFDDAHARRLEGMASSDTQWLDANDVQHRWPGVGRDCRGALFAPRDGAVDPQALTNALIGDARHLGTVVSRQAVRSVHIERGRITGVATADGTTAAGSVVIAAGAWSPRIDQLPRALPVEPVRGQMAVLPWPAGTPPAILYSEHSYVLTRGTEALIGSTMEHAGFDPRVTNEGLAQLFRCAARVLPALLRQPVMRMWAGLRPLTPDGQPIVGGDPAVPNLFYATGHGRNGVLLAALTGEVTADLVTGTHPGVDVTGWRVDREMNRA
ncbi:MAG TPA: glycine oxidase ThiO [Gemmatimonadales bacterium]|nr:glycine oxidase ThiO [Gemmatimonadales bacterium]